MVKKLQALKAKKGFTLVELVVVIAIIGVLAAILIPTMIGVVQDSRISSADTAASQVRTQVTTFFTKADTAGHTFQGKDNTILKFYVNGGTWSTTASASSSSETDGKGTGTDVSFLGGVYQVGTTSSGADKETNMCGFLAANLSDIKNACIYVYVDTEKCIGVSYIEGVSTDQQAQMPEYSDFSGTTGTCSKFSSKAGVVGNVVVGTNPKLQKAS